MSNVNNLTLFNDQRLLAKNNKLIQTMFIKANNPKFKITFWSLEERFSINRPMGKPIKPAYDLTTLLVNSNDNSLNDNPMGIIVNALRGYLNKSKYKDVNTFVLTCISSD